MAARVTWSPRALQDRKEILRYWIERNGTSTYSEKLNGLIKQAVQTIKDHPEAGKKTDIPHVRIKWVRDYQLFYKETEGSILILALWDYRRDPETFYL